jgi:murein DD-endopeptidase MepM/ murein hydrolase activator NlpD
MTRYCAIPPVNQHATEIGRGFGVGWNRSRTRMDQLHAGFDFKAGSGTPIIAPIDGVVSWTATDAQPRGTSGFGNMVALRHDVAVPGLPTPFFTSYNHMRAPSALVVGQAVRKGDLIGYVGNTTNGQFRGMGAHLHFEVRRRNYPSSYDRDTIDPAVLWRGLGYEWTDNRQEAERLVGGRLLAVRGGASDCDGAVAGLAGLAGMGTFTCLGGPSCPCPMCAYRRGTLGAVAPGYKDPVEKQGAYNKYGTSTVGQDVDPPDYASKQTPQGGEGGTSGGGAGLAIVGAAALFAVYALRSR